MEFIKPEKLNKGDTIGIFVPSSPVKAECRERGISTIKDMGYKPIEVNNIMSWNHYLAKKPEAGFQDLQEMLLNPEIKMLWAARGGYGANYLLPLLAGMKVDQPKIMMGSSDVSTLLWYFMDHFKWVVFYGPMAYSSVAEDGFDTDNLNSVLQGKQSRFILDGEPLIEGKANAIITGGCLSNFVSLIGTSYLPEIQDRILLLEDRNERPYRLDRMIWQLHQANFFSQIKGLVLGEFPQCFADTGERDNFFIKFTGLLREYKIPVINNLPLGHAAKIQTIPLGVRVEINTAKFSGIMVLEEGVRV